MNDLIEKVGWDAVTREFPSYHGLNKKLVELKQTHLAPKQEPQSPCPSEVGWGVIFSEGVSQEIKNLISGKLGALRWGGEPMNEKFRDLEPPGDRDVDAYLRYYGQEPETLIDPEQFPYYLLIVAPPSEVAFNFEVELGFRCAVGRLWLGDELKNYEAYVEREIRAERAASTELDVKIDIHYMNGRDLTMQQFQQGLIEKIQNVSSLKVRSFKPWNHTDNFKLSVDSEDVISMITGHGFQLHYQGAEDKLQNQRERLQGHLNPKFEISGGELENRDVVGSLVHLLETDRYGFGGDIIWSLSCFSAGTTHMGPCSWLKEAKEQQSSCDFNSQMSKDVLIERRAFIGSVDAVTTGAFTRPGWDGEFTGHIAGMLKGLQQGGRVGFLREYHLCSPAFSVLRKIEELRRKVNASDDDLASIKNLIRMYHDLTHIVIAGDPAVKMRV